MDDSIRLKLGKRLKELRKKRGFTQEQLSEKTGIDYKYVQRIESKKPPDIRLETIGRLAKALKTKPSTLLDF